MITDKQIYKFVKNCLDFPYPQICKHFVALELMGLLESSGYKINAQLVKYISQSSQGEEKAIEMLNNLIKGE